MWMQPVTKQNITKLFKICFPNTSMESLQQLKSILVSMFMKLFFEKILHWILPV